MQVNVEILGLADITELLTRTLPARVQSNVVAGAIKEAAKPMVQAIKRDFRALGGSGSLSLATSSWRDRKRETRGGQHFASVAVGPKRGNRRALAAYFAYYGKKVTPRQYQLGIRHGHLVEFGTRRGSPARNVLGRAQDTYGVALVNSFGGIMGRRIEEAAAKAAASQGRPSR